MRKAFLSILLVGTCLSGHTQKDSAGKRPDFTKMAYEDIKWAKADQKAFWFYHKPTQYFFQDNEFETISMENGDFLVYIHGMERYMLLPSFLKTELKIEKAVEPVTNSTCVFIRINRGRIWIYDRGKYVTQLEQAGYIERTHQYVYSSGAGKHYWIDEKDLLYGPMNTPIGIVTDN